MSFWRNIFNKSSKDIPTNINQKNTGFVIRLDNIDIAYLNYLNGEWEFYYSDEFRKQNNMHRIVGFSNLDKKYKSNVLWPFFKVRIPGLKQPLIKRILERENIDSNSEVDLLKRFGKNNISNPYKLLPI